MLPSEISALEFIKLKINFFSLRGEKPLSTFSVYLCGIKLKIELLLP